MKALPRRLVNSVVSGRAKASVPPPAGNGTITVTGFSGQACATACLCSWAGLGCGGALTGIGGTYRFGACPSIRLHWLVGALCLRRRTCARLDRIAVVPVL